jgi:hypothetical protein
MRKLWFLALLCACAPAPQWSKEGATAEMLAADLKACRQSAPLTAAAPMPRVKPAGSGMDFKATAERAETQFAADEQHEEACMKAKGYNR